MIHRQHIPAVDLTYTPPLRVLFSVRLSEEEAALLRQMQRDGGYPSLNCLFRSILQSVIYDEMKSNEIDEAA